MAEHKIALVVAAATNNAIGIQGELPWVLKDDMAIFKNVTLGHPVIMGRKTMEALKKPLPRRTNYVVTRQEEVLPGFIKANSIEAAITEAKSAEGSKLICIIGGGQIYAQSIELANVLYISRVEAEPEGGDAFFPDFDKADWKMESEVPYPADERNQYPFRFQIWHRQK
jgi:dihydrofolate reductase